MNGRLENTGQKEQNLIITLAFFVYAMAYFGRYSFSSSINSILSEFGVDKAQTGLVMTFFFIAYGIGQVVNGFLCKYYPKRYIFPVALWLSALINAVLFFGIKTGYIGRYFYLVKYIWMLNGIVQSLIWTSLIFTLGENIEQKNLAKSGVVLGMTVPVGTFVAYSISSLMEHFGYYEMSFALAAVVMTATGLAWLTLFKPYARTDVAESVSGGDEPVRKAGVKMPFAVIITLIGLSVFAISNNFIKDGLQTWIPTILKETYKFSNAAALILATGVYILGVLGTFIAKKLNERIKDFSALSLVFFVVIALSSAGISAFLNVSALPVILFFCMVMISGYAVNNIVTSLAPLFLRDHINPGVTAGVLDGFCYVGSALTTYLLGFVADRHGWNTVVLLLLTVAVFSVLICGALKLIQRKKQRVKL